MSMLHIKTCRIVSRQCALRLGQRNIEHPGLRYGEQLTDVETKDVLLVLECMMAHPLIPVIVEVQSLTNEILIFNMSPHTQERGNSRFYQAMKVMHAFDIHEKSTAIFVGTLNEVRLEATSQTIFF